MVQAHFSEAAHSEHCVLTTWPTFFTRYSQCVSLIAWPTSHFMAFGARKLVKGETKEEDLPTISPSYYAGFTASPCPMLHDIRRKQHHAHALPFVVCTGSRFHHHSKLTKFRGYKFSYSLSGLDCVRKNDTSRRDNSAAAQWLNRCNTGQSCKKKICFRSAF